MLTTLFVLALIGSVLFIASPEQKPAQAPEPRVIVIEKRVTVVERPVEVHNHYQVNILVANVDSTGVRNVLEPVRTAEPVALIGASTAIERYRRN